MEKIMSFEQLLSNIDAWIENVYLRNHTKEEILWNSYTAAFIVGFRDMLEGYLIPNEEYEEDDLFDANTNLILRYFNDGNDLIDLADAVFGANDPEYWVALDHQMDMKSPEYRFFYEYEDLIDICYMLSIHAYLVNIEELVEE